jgi:hypothetical protein
LLTKLQKGGNIKEGDLEGVKNQAVFFGKTALKISLHMGFSPGFGWNLEKHCLFPSRRY